MEKNVKALPALLVGLSFVVSLILINVYPFKITGQTELLTAFHLPVLLWLLMSFLYQRQDKMEGKMNFIRFTGETFIYTVLILCGGAVLAGIAIVIFNSIGIDIENLVGDHLAVTGIFAAPVAAAFLVEAKKSVVENLAPVLARIFSPLFIVTMLVFLVVMTAFKTGPFINREILIAFNILLVIVLGIVLYVISARPSDERPGLFDYLNLVLILVALVVNIVAISAVVFRLSSFGITPNKIAALGENILLLMNIGGLAAPYTLFFFRKLSFKKLEVWQTRCIPVYIGWMAVIIFVFPLIFQFA